MAVVRKTKRYSNPWFFRMFGAALGLHQDVGGGSGGTDGYVVTGAGHSSHDTWMTLSGNFNGFCPLLEKCGA